MTATRNGRTHYRRDPRADVCAYSGCSEPAGGDVWPVKITGQPLAPAMRACERHVDIAEIGGAVVARDTAHGPYAIEGP